MAYRGLYWTAESPSGLAEMHDAVAVSLYRAVMFRTGHALFEVV